jgi:retinol-binding protein 3
MRLVKIALIALAAAGISAPSIAAQAQPSRVTVPDTPAGTIFRAWLDAFNSGDSLRLDAYYRQYEPDRIGPSAMATQRLTGGFDLVALERTGPRQIEVTLKERKLARLAYAIFTTPSDGSTKVASSRLISMGANADVARLDAAARARVIEGALAQLDEWYVFPDVAKQAGDSLRARLKRGAYDSYTSAAGFAVRLHDELREIAHDKHMSVAYAVTALPPAPAQQGGPPSPQVTANQQAQADANNCGFVKVEVLPGNIGYLKFNGFANPNLCAPTASAAMNFLAGTKALIVDLRENGGGSPAMVSYISSYLFSQKTHLNDLWDRKSGQTTEFWTRDDVPGRKFGGEKPVYVLTATRTFSGAEEFSYNLKSLKRAVIVGETTGGGAHPVGPHRIDDHFQIAVPYARAINPITKTNWEGVGVEPDVKVPASEALTTALKLLAEKSKP